MYSRSELEASFQLLLQRAQWKRRVPLALANQDAFTNPARVSMLPIGSDGMRTITFLKNPDLHYGEMIRKLHRHEANEHSPYHFRPVREQKKFTKSGKGRIIYCYSLVDQIVIKAAQQELKQGWGKIYSGQKHPMDTAYAIFQEIQQAGPGVKILKMDITKFFPSINRDILFADLKKETDIRPALYRLIVAANSLAKTTGLVTGGSLSTLLSEFYLRNLRGVISENIGFHRFADDICLVVPASHNPMEIKQQVIEALASIHLNLSAEKSKLIDPMEDEFEFLGINFLQGKPNITEDEVDYWKSRVQKEVFSEKAKLRIYQTLQPELTNLPSSKEIQNTIWSQHFMGIRSRFNLKYTKYKKYFGAS